MIAAIYFKDMNESFIYLILGLFAAIPLSIAGNFLTPKFFNWRSNLSYKRSEQLQHEIEKSTEISKSEAGEIIELLGKTMLSGEISLEFLIEQSAALAKKDESETLKMLNSLLVQAKRQAEKLIEQIKQKEETVNGKSVLPEHNCS